MKQTLILVLTISFYFLFPLKLFAKIDKFDSPFYQYISKRENLHSSSHKTRSGLRLIKDSSFTFNNGPATYSNKTDYKYNSNHGFDIIQEEINSFFFGTAILNNLSLFNNNITNVHQYDSSIYTYYSNTSEFIVVNTFNITHQTIETTDFELTNFILTPNTKKIKTLNANKQVIKEETFIWNGLTWDNQSECLSTFNNNLVIKTIQKAWNVNSGTWDSLFLTNLSYDVNNKLIALEEYKRNFANTGWLNYRKYIFSYNANSKIDSLSSQKGDSLVWNFDFNEKFTYNNNNQLTHINEYVYNPTLFLYGYYDLTYANNTDKYAINYLEHNWDGLNYTNYSKYEFTYLQNNYIETKNFYNWTNGVWVKKRFNKFYYDIFTPANVEIPINKKQINIYPNPANSFIIINLIKDNNIKIYSLNGQLIYEQFCYSGGSKIVVDKLISGTYILELVNENKSTFFTKN
jgi:hypothetical protein